MSDLWPEDSSFESFRSAFPITKENLYKELFYHFRDRIQVQREEPAVRNLEIIFTATFKLSAQKGFHAMSLRDLSQETQISMGGLYKYINGKDDLAYMIVEFVGQRLTKQLYLLAEQESQIEHKLDQLIRIFAYIVELYQPWFFFMFMEAKNMSAENRFKAKAYELGSIHKFSSVLRSYLEKNKGPDIDVLLTSSTVIAAIEAWYLKHWHYADSGTNIDQYADYCVALTKKLLQ